MTGTPASAARIDHERQPYPGGRQAGLVPVGVALFPKEITLPPRQWVEGQVNLVHWTEMPRGGYLAALEQPALLVADVRTSFRKRR